MRQTPPPQLVVTLEQLGLAAAQVYRMEGRVRRLTQDLPCFESVWLDALAQARLLTPFQAAQINAGRGEALRVGPYLLCQPVACNYVSCYRALDRQDSRTVRLVVLDNAGPRPAEILHQLKNLAAASQALHSSCLSPITAVGEDAGRVWAASPWIEGHTAAEWLVQHGRFPADAVLEIARTVLVGLVELEKCRLVHGDISTSSLLLTEGGGVVLTEPGLRGIIRPTEGYAHADLGPDAYDALAPERVADGTPPNTASDIYACGCLWWHLLCGRTPLPGGDSLARLRAAQTAAISNVRQWATEVPDVLSEAISACLRRDPRDRPESLAALAAMLGVPTRGGRQALARCLSSSRRPVPLWSALTPSAASSRIARRLTAAAVGLMLGLAVLWPLWSRYGRDQGPEDRGQRPEARGQRPAGSGGKGEGGRATASLPGVTNSSDVVVSSEGRGDGTLLRLKPGQRVRAAPGKRATLSVPRNGLEVNVDDVCFENIDFVWDHAEQSMAAADRGPAAIVQLAAARAEFRGCSFQSAPRSLTPPAAIVWTHPADPAIAASSLPTGRLKMSNCVLRRVTALVDSRTLGAIGVELVNVLYQGQGAILKLDHCPAADEPVRIALAQVTLRGAGLVMECRYTAPRGAPGEISIEATRCVFATGAGAALLLFAGPDSPEPLLRNVKWTGQGSLVVPQAAIAAWRRPDGSQQPLDDATVSIAGLVRSGVEFAGPADRDAAAQRIISWQAPLQSADPPGIDAESLATEDPSAFDKPGG